jgi:hypothetical protein
MFHLLVIARSRPFPAERDWKYPWGEAIQVLEIRGMDRIIIRDDRNNFELLTLNF